MSDHLDIHDPPLRIEVQWIQRERSAAPLLVFLHEGLGSIAMWRGFPRALCEAGGFRGLVYSRPGYGRSTPRRADERWSTDFLHVHAYEILPKVLEAAGVDARGEPVWLFGHSDGASIALLHAARFPERVRGMVVLAPHLFIEPVCLENIAEARSAYIANLRAQLARYHDDVDSAFWGWNDAWLDPAFRSWNIEDQVAQVRCPVLAVQGFHDEYGTMRQIERIGELVPGTELLRLDHCRHSPYRDQPQAVIEAGVRWIGEKSTS